MQQGADLYATRSSMGEKRGPFSIAELGVAASVAAMLTWVVAAPRLGSGARLGVLALAAAGSSVAVLRSSKDGLASKTVVAAGIVLLAAAVAAPPRESNDLWGYVSYARVLSVHGYNPYRTAPAPFRDDPLLDKMSAEYRDTPSVYGPLFTVVSAGITALLGENQILLRLAFQSGAAAAVALSMLLLHRNTSTSARSLALVALNPAVMVTVNGGHPDLAAGALVLAAASLRAKKHDAKAGLLLGCALLVKLTAGLAAVGMVAWSLGHLGLRRAAALAAPGCLVLALGYAVFGGPTALEPLKTVAMRGTRSQVWEIVRDKLTIEAERRGVDDPAETAHNRLRAPAVAVLVGFVVVAAVGFARRGHPAESAVGVAVAGMTVSKYSLPWYVCNFVPTAALVPGSGAAVLLWLESVRLVLVYADPPGTLPPPGWLEDLSLRILPLASLLIAAAAISLALRGRDSSVDLSQPH